MRSLRDVAGLVLGGLALLGAAAPAAAQFDEPDTLPRFGIGPVIELTFRGVRGTSDGGTEVELTNGPAFGLRAEYRLTRTGTIAVIGTYARSEEQLNVVAATPTSSLGQDLTLYQVAGEILFKMKESVPGFFALGGGLRFVDASGEAGFLRADVFTEPILTGGLGLEFLLSRRDVLRASGRYYFGIIGEQSLRADFDDRTTGSDFALGFAYLRRF